MFQDKILSIYRDRFKDISYETGFVEISQCAGGAYAEIYELNKVYGYHDGENFDDVAVYYMAEWLQTHVQNKHLEELEVKDIASGISEQIIGYYRLEKYRKDDIVVLLLTSEPENNPRLRVGAEGREIKDIFDRAQMRERIRFVQRHAVRAKDISSALLDLKPTIVHFSGHGTQEGYLYFEDDAGRANPVEPQALSRLFRLFSKHTICVLLNACYSEDQATAISKHIYYVIGMEHDIFDQGAMAFSEGFYQALGSGEDFEKAFQFGCIEMTLRGIPGDRMPVLFRGNTRIYAED